MNFLKIVFVILLVAKLFGFSDILWWQTFIPLYFMAALTFMKWKILLDRREITIVYGDHNTIFKRIRSKFNTKENE